MIGKLLKGLIDFVISLVGIILLPIDSLISNAFPSLSNAIQSINDLINYIIGVIGYAIDASGLSDIAIFMVVAYYSFSITCTLSASALKLALKWYEKLKP